MRFFEPVERVADRSRARWLFDVLVAIVAAASTVPYLFHDNAHPPSAATAIPVVVVLVAPLVLRRVFPVPVLIWLLAASVATGMWNDHVIPGLALLVALYTIASLQPRRVAVAAAALIELVVLAAAIHRNGVAFWYDSIFLSGLVGAALGLGLYAGTRRAYLAELHDRAERLERERDQQGALAAAAERSRITREMHDVVAHHLTVMVALSDGAIAATAASPERGIEVMRTVSATGRRALSDTRRLLGVLRDNKGDDRREALQPMPGLADLDELLERIRAAGLPVSFEVHGARSDVPAGIQLTVYRLVQEALTNTLKHGGPDARASVRMHYLSGELRLDVIDDGAGLAAPSPVGVGGGLTGMRERVLAFGGDLQAGPGRPSGWRVSARLRLDEADVS
jgi:signal transduction histidine kinase